MCWKIKVSNTFYACKCNTCGWIGSSEYCGVDGGYEGDSDVYCPRCGSNDTDEYGERYPWHHFITDLFKRIKAWKTARAEAKYWENIYKQGNNVHRKGKEKERQFMKRLIHKTVNSCNDCPDYKTKALADFCGITKKEIIPGSTIPESCPLIAKIKVVCLCGSTKFKQEFITANFRETMAGKIVLTVGWFSHTDGNIFTPSPQEKIALDELHKRKIDLADEILIINPGGYIGESTRSEIEYAFKLGKPILYWDNDHGELSAESDAEYQKARSEGRVSRY